MKIAVTLFTLLTLFSTAVYADHSGHDGNKHVHTIMAKSAIVIATPPGVKNSAVYFTIENSTSDDVIITSAQSNASHTAELHGHSMIDGAMSMRQLKSVHVPAYKKVTFQPHASHVMLFGLKNPLVAGGTVELTLGLSNGKSVHVTADIVMPGDLDSTQVHKKGMSSDGEMVKKSHSHH